MESVSAPGQYKSAYKKYNKWNNWNKNKDGNNEGAESNDNQKPSSNYTPSNQPETSFDLGKNKRVTVRQFRNVNLIDIREYYKDSNGDLKPGKKGISLTEDMFDSLLSNYKNIDDALKRLGSDRKNNIDSHAFDNLKNSDSKITQSSTAGTLLIDNSGSVKSEDGSIGSKRSLEEQKERDNKRVKENGSQTPAPPQEEQHKKVEALENSANLVIPTKQEKKEVDSDDDFANDLENELNN